MESMENVQPGYVIFTQHRRTDGRHVKTIVGGATILVYGIKPSQIYDHAKFQADMLNHSWDMCMDVWRADVIVGGATCFV